MLLVALPCEAHAFQHHRVGAERSQVLQDGSCALHAVRQMLRGHMLEAKWWALSTGLADVSCHGEALTGL